MVACLNVRGESLCVLSLAHSPTTASTAPSSLLPCSSLQGEIKKYVDEARLTASEKAEVLAALEANLAAATEKIAEANAEGKVGRKAGLGLERGSSGGSGVSRVYWTLPLTSAPIRLLLLFPSLPHSHTISLSHTHTHTHAHTHAHTHT
jgi:hypothetical protein